MVHFCLVSTHQNTVDAIETHVVDRGSGDNHEVRSLASWRHWLGHDVNSVVAGQYYGATPGHQKRQGSPTSPHFVPTVPTVNTVLVNPMTRTDIKLPIFNGNGLEDPEQHWFLCEVVCTVQHI